MILILHTTARYLALATITTAGTAFASILLVRRICRVTPEARASLDAFIADQFA